MSVQSNNFWQVDTPSLEGLAYGTPTLESLEAVDFSSDSRLLVVLAKFSDAGDPSVSFKYAHFIYDVKTQAYIANLNSVMGDNALVTQTIDARIVGTVSSWEVVANVRVVGQNSDELRSYTSDQTLTRDLLGSELTSLSYLGSPSEIDVDAFRLNSNGRFLAVQTESPLLAINNDDQNSSQDIYLVDRDNGLVRRVSYIGGAERPDSVYLADMRVSASELELAFVTAEIFSADDFNSSDSTLSIEARNDLYLASTTFTSSSLSDDFSFSLKSVDSAGNATGFVSRDTDLLPIITSAGVFFSSSATNLIETDNNSSSDVFLSTNEGVQRVYLSGIDEISGGADLVGASSNGKTVYIKSSSQEFSGLGGVDQIIKVSATNGDYEVVSNNGVQADNTVINGAVSPNGGVIGFTSLASNIVSNNTTQTEYDLYLHEAGTTAGKIYDWNSHTLLSDVTVGSSNGIFEEVTSSSEGTFELSTLIDGDAQLTFSRDASADDGFIDFYDAIAALQIAININPNSGSRSISPYQYYAADVDKDGNVDFFDAIDILKMAISYPGAPEREWLFFDEAANLTEANHAAALAGELPTSKVFSIEDADPAELNFVGVFKGDVLPSWASSSGSAVTLDDAYFQGLEQAGVASADQWWVV